jgi:hypothetical protein
MSEITSAKNKLENGQVIESDLKKDEDSEVIIKQL